jgi:hypothetical protein
VEKEEEEEEKEEEEEEKEEEEEEEEAAEEEKTQSRKELILRTSDIEAAQEDTSVPRGKEEAEVGGEEGGGGGRTPPTWGRDAQGEGVPPYMKAGSSISPPYIESERVGAEDAGSWKRAEDWEGQVDVFFKKSLCYVALLPYWANRETGVLLKVCMPLRMFFPFSLGIFRPFFFSLLWNGVCSGYVLHVGRLRNFFPCSFRFFSSAQRVKHPV